MCVGDFYFIIIPQGITQVYWDYYNTSEKIYRAMISVRQKMCRPIVFSGGLWTWSGPSVNFDFGEDESGEYNFPEHESRISSVSKQVLYQNPLYGLFDKNLCGRLARAEQMTRTAARRVGEFLDGKIQKIEELEQERLWYNGIERPCLEFWSPRIMTP